MPRVAVMTDSNSGITQLDGKNMGVGVMPMPFTIDGKIYYEDVSLSREEFFQMMADDKNILSSQPAPADLLEMWDKALEKKRPDRLHPHEQRPVRFLSECPDACQRLPW